VLLPRQGQHRLGLHTLVNGPTLCSAVHRVPCAMGTQSRAWFPGCLRLVSPSLIIFFFSMLQCCHAAISPAIPNHGISPSTPGAPPWPVQTPLNALTYTLNSPRFELSNLPWRTSPAKHSDRLYRHGGTCQPSSGEA
jgi:hypothetical protein